MDLIGLLREQARQADARASAAQGETRRQDDRQNRDHTTAGERGQVELEGIDTTPVPDYANMLRLEGRGVVVIGAGRGMGRQSAHAVASVGGRVLCVDVDAERANAVAKEVDGVPLVGDVRDTEAVDEMVRVAKAEFGEIHGVVDIVGMARYGRIVETSEEDWDWVNGMVVRHAFLVIRAFGRAMTEQRHGSMVFITSMNGIASAPFHSAYGAAKAGLVHLVKTAAWELRGAEVRVNSVAPGTIASPRVAFTRGMDPAELADGKLASMGKTSDIARAVLFFLSDLAAYVTGQTLAVDGAILAKNPFDFDEPPLPAGQAMGVRR
jgi:NAD(P)-dependent dehydrogenase (short-subunit alcohol dehydrogenase family)